MTLPAVAGGKPVRDTLLNFSSPCIDAEDIRAVAEALSGNTLSMGKTVSQFEKAFAAYTGARYAVAVSSGSAGMHIALLAGGIGPQEEVIASPLTHPGSTNAILYQKAVPIFTDVDADTMTLDPDQVTLKINERTKAIILSHYGGFPCRVNTLLETARRYGLLVLEDATRSLGAVYKGKMVGVNGDMGIFSFSGTQGVTTGEGGMVATDDSETYRWLSMFRDGGMIREKEGLTRYPGPWHLEMQDLGYNYRMTEMQAALGLSQLRKADKFLGRRREIAEEYTMALAGIDRLILPEPSGGASPAWEIYPVRLRPELLSAGRGEIIAALLAENVEVDVKYLPVHMQPYYIWVGHPDVCKIEGSLCPVAENIYENLVCLPIYPSMSSRDIKDVIAAVTRVFDYYGK